MQKWSAIEYIKRDFIDEVESTITKIAKSHCL